VSRLTVALVGAGGQLGKTLQSDWAASAPSDFQLHPFSRAELDICSAEQLAQRLDPLNIQLVVNAAAYTQVDKAESEPDQAMAINRDGVARLAQWVADRGSRLIHVSTDFVFDGLTARPRQPGDHTSPLNHYGQSKLAGELAVQANCPDRAVILRTGWLYSRHQPNFVTTMLRLMSERSPASPGIRKPVAYSTGPMPGWPAGTISPSRCRKSPWRQGCCNGQSR